jgi:hypothetical protein
MYDAALVGDVLREILAAIRTVAKRFAPVRSVDDFVQSEAGECR